MMKIVLALLVVVVVVSAGTPEKKQVAIDAPPAKPHNNVPPPVSNGRKRRAATCGTQTKCTAAQADQSIYAHNLFRAQENAANMLKAEWSDEMAAVAQAWADQCKWEHGMLYDCSGNRCGQNLFVEASVGGYPALNLTYVAECWANEKKDYDFNSQTCAPNKICGHYTQLAGARSNKVGCAYALCPTMNVGGSVWKNALYVVCDYSPAGNVMGESMYKAGTKCSNCDSDSLGTGYKCDKNLCTQCTPATDSACKCGTPAQCLNGGTWSASTCSCVCPAKKFYGTTCESACSCADASPNCGGWSAYCTNADYSDFMGENCKATCKYPCTLPPSCY